MPTLVIVESPTKARTISKFLPDHFRVEACMGHVRDLPGSAAEIPPQFKKESWAKEHGINIEQRFEPLYVVPPGKRRIVTELKKALKDAQQLIIATDEDREGESIGWHLLQVLKPKVPVDRMVFHEITRTAIEDALAQRRTIDENLVRAQEVRRILDRLVGYTVSPLLWIKIAPGLSAGRVQSVAVRVLVERERERRLFRSARYWELRAQVDRGGETFGATLTHVAGQRTATGRDFDETTGRLKDGAEVLLLGEDAAQALTQRLGTVPWRVEDVERKPRRVKPYPPFTTSTLQQEANRKLRLSSRETMRIAQRLYERGLITYMRTDSVNLSNEAIGAARACVARRYGEEFLSPEERRFATTSKGAQEAHEAIRPAGDVMPTADEASLIGREKQLYDLIWKRTMATQMADCEQELISVRIAADDATFRASGKRIVFHGFFRAYVEGSDDPAAALDDKEVPIPNLHPADVLAPKDIEALMRETRPPARFTEASLVARLEKEGIGRPSTYATIIDTILQRDYARKQGGALVPTFTAYGVTQLMEGNFDQFVDTGFTASMEAALDKVASGEVEWLPYLEKFWSGESGLEAQIAAGREGIDPRQACTLADFGDLGARVRIGRYGPYIELGDGDDVLRVSIPEDLAPGDLSPEKAADLIRQKQEGPRPIAVDPETGMNVYLMTGRYGPYVQVGEVTEEVEKPKRVSLPKGIAPEDLTPEKALRLIGLPRTLGVHPETGEPIVAALGRYGPYVAHSGDFRSLAPTDDVLTIELARSLEIFAEEKVTGRRRGPQALREVGAHPGDGEPVVLMSGRYGAYVTHGGVNATLPMDLPPAELSLEDAVTLLRAKAEQLKDQPQTAKKKRPRKPKA